MTREVDTIVRRFGFPPAATMSGVSIAFHSLTEDDGVAVLDPIESRRLVLSTDRPVSPDATATDGFVFPVDAACAFETGSLRLDRMDYLTVWTDDGTPLETVGSRETRSFEAGTYQIEISAPIKLYLEVRGGFTVASGLDHIDLDLADEGQVVVGARSYHESPAATVTVGDDPRDAMAAISTFSSALKVTTPDVSFPTLRGHPPLVERGDALSIPDGLDPVDSGITIAVPANRRFVYPTASLAYYLGATVEPGDAPRLYTDDGFTYDLGTDRWFEDEVARVLEQVLLFDAVVRSEGIHGQDVAERRTVEPLLGTDLETLYDLPMRERVAEYLAVSADDVADVGPRWAMTAFVPPTAECVDILPHVVNELGFIRSPRGTRIEDREARTELGVPDERSRRYVSVGDRQRMLVSPALVDDSVEHVWFGEDVPVGATKGTIEAFRAALTRSSPPDAIDIAVVYNDEGERQRNEDLLAAYRTREDRSYDVDTFVGATTAELSAVLQTSYDFLHFVGETRPGGIVTDDGTLSLADIDRVAVGAFALDADHSFEEALWLARHGALGGIGTVGRVDSAVSTDIGRSLAYLLNKGFPLRAALDIVREHETVGEQYVVVGNGSVDVAQPDSAVPSVVDVRILEDDVSVLWDTYPGSIFRVGTAATPVSSAADSFIGPGHAQERVTLSKPELREVVERSDSPVRIDGDLYWHSEAILDALD